MTKSTRYLISVVQKLNDVDPQAMNNIVNRANALNAAWLEDNAPPPLTLTQKVRGLATAFGMAAPVRESGIGYGKQEELYRQQCVWENYLRAAIKEYCGNNLYNFVRAPISDEELHQIQRGELRDEEKSFHSDLAGDWFKNRAEIIFYRLTKRAQDRVLEPAILP